MYDAKTLEDVKQINKLATGGRESDAGMIDCLIDQLVEARACILRLHDACIISALGGTHAVNDDMTCTGDQLIALVASKPVAVKIDAVGYYPAFNVFDPEDGEVTELSQLDMVCATEEEALARATKTIVDAATLFGSINYQF